MTKKIRSFLRRAYAVIIALHFILCNNIAPLPSSDYECSSGLDSIVNLHHPKAARYQAFLDSLTRSGMVGVSVLISTPKDGIWAGSSGMADIAANADMRPCSLFRIMSITKMFTAAAILKLTERGLLDLNDRAADHLPGTIVDKIANCDKVTINQLLHHTGGIPELHTIRYNLDQYNNPSKTWTQMDLLDEAAGEPAVCTPGECCFYSDVNYILLGMIINRVAGINYDRFIREEILASLTLSHTFFNVSDPTPGGTVRGYQDIHGNGTIEDCSILWDNVVPGAEGGIVTDVFDLYVFANELLRGKFLKDSTLTEMETFIEGEGMGLAQGHSMYGTFIGHGGSERGYNSWVMYFKDTDVCVIWFSNGPYSMLSSNIVTNTFNLWALSPTAKVPFYDLVFE
jgi:D-alanyl-D-alanine carboxypeptidase